MARKVSVKCAIAGRHYQRKMTLAEREGLKWVEREANAAVGLLWPDHEKAAFNFALHEVEDVASIVGGEPELVWTSRRFRNRKDATGHEAALKRWRDQRRAKFRCVAGAAPGMQPTYGLSVG